MFLMLSQRMANPEDNTKLAKGSIEAVASPRRQTMCELGFPIT